MNKIAEGSLEFSFDDNYNFIKFDSQPFYDKYKSSMYEGKGVDILSYGDKYIQIIEVKDFEGYESENKWRIIPNDKQIDKRPKNDNGHNLDIEVVQKVASSIACMYGARTLLGRRDNADVYEDFWTAMNSDKVLNDKVQLLVILHLEGNIGSKTRPMSVHLRDIRRSIEKKLDWLNCKVLVQSSQVECDNRLYCVGRVK